MRKLWLALCIIALWMLPLTAQDDIVGPDEYPEGINPLTGLQVDDPDVLNQRPLVVKIINAPAEVRPQYGLMQADIVWEHLLAGGITRFSAIYYGQEPDFIGPVRSARLVDFELIRIYRGLFSYSGMSDGTLQIMNGDALVSSRAVGGIGPCPALCRSEELNEKLEYTLFGNVPEIRLLAEERERDITPEPVFGMAFSETIPENGTDLERVNVAYVNTNIDWEWDADLEKWVRSQDGALHLDADTDELLTADNVIIFEEEHTEQPFVRDQFWGPTNFAFSVNFIGSGRAVFLRDGQYFEGEWRRETQDGVLTYFDSNGETWTFKPGNTFINLVPRWVEAYQLTFYVENPARVGITVESGILRGGPGSGYPATDIPGYLGDEFPALGRNNGGDWVQIQMADGRIVWVSTEIAAIDIDVMNLPLARPTIEN